MRTATQPRSTGFRAGAFSRGVTRPVPLVYLPALLTAPGPSGSAGPSRLRRGCSRPPRRSPAQAASSFTPPLRRQRDQGLSPQFGQTAPRGAPTGNARGPPAGEPPAAAISSMPFPGKPAASPARATPDPAAAITIIRNKPPGGGWNSPSPAITHGPPHPAASTPPDRPPTRTDRSVERAKGCPGGVRDQGVVGGEALIPAAKDRPAVAVLSGR